MPRHTGRHHVRLNRVALGGRPGFSFHNTVHFLRSVNPTIPMTTDSNAHKATTVCASIANTPFRGCRPASEAPHLPLYLSDRCVNELFSQFKCLFSLDSRKVLARFRQDPRKLHARFRQGREEAFRRKIRTNVSRETSENKRRRRIEQRMRRRLFLRARQPACSVQPTALPQQKRARESGAKRVPYSSSSTAGATTSGTDAVGSNRRTTLPSRSTRNFVKFHLTDGLEA